MVKPMSIPAKMVSATTNICENCGITETISPPASEARTRKPMSQGTNKTKTQVRGTGVDGLLSIPGTMAVTNTTPNHPTLK